VIGYDEGPAIHHYYVGELADLEAFTLDFLEGEIRFAASAQEDSCQKLFHEIPEWTERRQWGRAEAWEMARLRMRTSTADAARCAGVSIWSLYCDAAGWALQAAVGIHGEYGLALLAAKLQRWILLRALKNGDRDRARQAFLRWIGSLTRQGRTAFLYRNSELLCQARAPGDAIALKPAGSFGAERAQDLLGFHGLETDGGSAFRWSSQCAAAFVPLVKGENLVEIEWREVRPLDADNRDTLCFFVNGCRLPYLSVGVEPCRAVIRVNSPATGECMLSWTVRPFPATNDHRVLGLPIHRIAWKSTN
jgi:hypothetical protein